MKIWICAATAQLFENIIYYALHTKGAIRSGDCPKQVIHDGLTPTYDFGYAAKEGPDGHQ